nr:unnamed protein product [Spirometra erinaceieuropaei]
MLKLPVSGPRLGPGFKVELLLTSIVTVGTSAKTLTMRQSEYDEYAASPIDEVHEDPSSSLRYTMPEATVSDENKEVEDHHFSIDDDYDQNLLPEEVDSDWSQSDDQIEDIEEKGPRDDNSESIAYSTSPEAEAGTPQSASLSDSTSLEDAGETIIVPEVRWTEGRGVLAGLPPTDEPDTSPTDLNQSADPSRSEQGSQAAVNDGPEDLSSRGREVDAVEREQPRWDANEANVVFNIDDPDRNYINKVLDSEDEYEAVERDFMDTSAPIRRSRPPWPERNLTALGARPRHPACHQPLDMGVGPGELSSWYYDISGRSCLWFPYAGYGGNANRFYTRTACQDLCVFEKSNLCESVECNYRNSRCVLMGDESCRSYMKDRGKDVNSFCPPDQPVCQNARRSIFLPKVEGRILPPECYEPLDYGNCDQKPQLSRYYYNAESNSCLFFLFRGCGGNNNRFKSKSDCMNHCAL